MEKEWFDYDYHSEFVMNFMAKAREFFAPGFVIEIDENGLELKTEVNRGITD